MPIKMTPTTAGVLHLTSPANDDDIADLVDITTQVAASVTTALGQKAPTSHAHTVAQVTGLQTALDGKAPTSHQHDQGDVTGLQTALDGKAPTSHAHTVAQVTGLQTALDGKAPTSHAHTVAQVTGLQTALDGKAPKPDPNFAVPGELTASTAEVTLVHVPGVIWLGDSNRMGESEHSKATLAEVDLTICADYRSLGWGRNTLQVLRGTTLKTLMGVSSRRYKTRIEDASPSGVLDVQPARFSMVDGWDDPADTSPHLGVIAEQAAAVFPDGVRTDQDGLPYTVEPMAFIAGLIHEVRILRDRVTALESGKAPSSSPGTTAGAKPTTTTKRSR